MGPSSSLVSLGSSNSSDGDGLSDKQPRSSKGSSMGPIKQALASAFRELFSFPGCYKTCLD